MKPIIWNVKLWKGSVEQFHNFLQPLIAGLGRSERRVAAAARLYVIWTGHAGPTPAAVKEAVHGLAEIAKAVLFGRYIFRLTIMTQQVYSYFFVARTCGGSECLAPPTSRPTEQ